MAQIGTPVPTHALPTHALPTSLAPDWLAPLRGTVFLAALLLVWLSLKPFSGLAGNEPPTVNDAPTYAAFALMAMVAFALAFATQRHMLLAQARPATAVLLCWLAFTVLISGDFSASLRRFVLFAMMALLALSLFLLPQGRRQFTRLMLGASAVLLVLSYAGVLLAPEVTIHQAIDLIEPQLAGDWRGVFSHKNTAGAIFSVVVFIGLYSARAGFPISGLATALVALVFLVFSGAKSSMVLLPTTLVAWALVTRLHSPLLRAIVALGPILLLNTFGAGTALSETLAAIVKVLPVDATFTGRLDVWTFAFEKIAQQPVAGYGFNTFWTLDSTRFGTEMVGEWASVAAHAHNSYIDAALNIGLVGLALMVVVFIVQPLRDALNARASGADPAITDLMAQIWLFGLYLSAMENLFFARDDPMWFMLLFAVFSLRYLAARPATSA